MIASRRRQPVYNVSERQRERVSLGRPGRDPGHKPGTSPRPTRAIAAKRNLCAAALADRLLVPHAEPGGSTERLCREALADGKPVFTLDSSENAHLLEFGATPVPADDLTLLPA